MTDTWHALTGRMKPTSSLSLLLIVAITACPQVKPPAAEPVVSGRLMRSDLTVKAASSGASASSLASAQAARVPGELVVRYREGQPGTLRVRPAGLRSERRLGSVSVLEVDAGNEEGVRAQLEKDPNVESVGPNYLYKRLSTPNDPFFAQQTNLNLIGAPSAWNTQKGAAGVLVAVLDDGYNANQTDMVTRIVHPCPPLVRGDSCDPGQTDIVGRIALPTPRAGLWLDPGNGDNQPTEFPGNATFAEDTHGGGVASVIAALTDNAQGIAGVTWQGVQVVPIKIFTDPGTSAPSSGTSATIAAALDTAIDVGARVINMSFCLVDSSTKLCSSASDSVIDASLEKAYKAGAVLVAASGNDASSAGYVAGSVAYPALNRYVLAVGSIENTLGRSNFSDYGPSLDLVAPGRNVWVLSGTDVAQESGTSFSSPTVAGVAALLRSNGLTSPDVIVARLLETAQDLGTGGRDDQTGNGLVRADLALAGPDAAQGYPVTTTVSSGGTVVQTVKSTLQPGRSMGAYSLGNIANGTYTVRVSVDVNRNGVEDSGDLVGQRSITVTSLPLYGQDVTLTAVP